MKTKEAILDSMLDNGHKYGNTAISHNLIFKAMDEYAKHQVMEFARYISCAMPAERMNKLYTQFIESQNNNQ